MRIVKLILPVVLIGVIALGCAKKQVVQPVEEPVVVEPIPVEVEPERPALLLQRIFFDLDKSDIRADAAKILSKNVEMLKLYPEVKIVIEGHCCELGTSEYNLGLGERRAKAAYDYLVMMGADMKRLSTISYGEERPLDPNDLPSNRRCEFVPMK
ncbi:MAG: OmpA family protein [candidate division WOR-3 bacterium]|nr:MAG: OmpA family protein [candidate division WOR-3 bacterium]